MNKSNKFRKDRFYQTITIGTVSMTTFLKIQYFTASKKDIRKWEKEYDEDANKKIPFKGCEEKSFEIEIREGCRHTPNKVRITDEETGVEYTYTLDNDSSEFTIGEYSYSFGKDFSSYEEEE